MRWLILTLMVILIGVPQLQAQEQPVKVQPINKDLLDRVPNGTLNIASSEGTVTIDLQAQGLPPGMHLAHLHGFAEADPAEARCPDATADVNGDGIVDLIETREAAGVTLVPLTDRPASLQIHSDAYPTANAQGEVSYHQRAPLNDLQQALEEKHGTPLALDQRVLFIHGVTEDVNLPDTVQSLEGVPAHVTVPIACAELEAG